MSEPLANTTDELSEQLAQMGSLEEQGVSSLPAETDRNEVDDEQIEESKSENESSRNDAIPGVEKALLHRNGDGGNDSNIANDSLHHSSIAGGEVNEIPEPSEPEIEPLPGPAGDGDVVPVQPESESESGGVDDVDLGVDEPVKMPASDHSPEPKSRAKSDKSRKPKVNSHSPKKVLDFKADRRKVNSHSDSDKWKKSRLKPGYLIARIKGYDIVESEYGVSYLFVVTRKPEKKTSGDFSIHEHAGFSTWQALEVNGRLMKGASNDRISRNRTRAS